MGEEIKKRQKMISFFKRKWEISCVWLLLLVHVLLCAGFLKSNYLTVDEPVHITGGLEMLQNGGYTMNPESGVIPQITAALGLCGKIEMPPELTMESMEKSPYPYSRYILFEYGKLTEQDFLLARLVMCIFSVACAFLLWRVARPVGGRAGALLMLGIYVFLPLFISNAPLATADMAATCFFIMTLFAGVRLIRKYSLGNWCFFTAASMGLILSKMSGCAVAPVLLVLWGLSLFSRGRVILKMPFTRRTVQLENWKKRLAAGFLALCMAALAGWGILWAAYGFREDFPKVTIQGKVVRDYENFSDHTVKGTVPDMMRFLGEHSLVPKPFAYGFLHTYHYAQRRWSFLNGEESMTGFRSFFPLVFLYKTPPATILALLLGCICMGVSLKTRIGRTRFK